MRGGHGREIGLTGKMCRCRLHPLNFLLFDHQNNRSSKVCTAWLRWSKECPLICLGTYLSACIKRSVNSPAKSIKCSFDKQNPLTQWIFQTKFLNSDVFRSFIAEYRYLRILSCIGMPKNTFESSVFSTKIYDKTSIRCRIKNTLELAFLKH